MKHILKRSMAMLMALVMCISLLPAVRLTADATADAFSYVYSSDGKYIYNWGTRGETATSLSPNAETFYSNGNTYDILSAHPGGTGTSNAPSSALYGALQSLMAGKQTYQTSYDATRPLFQYTDCQNSGNPNTISSFYSGKAIGPAWDGGATWNREHTWPNSKGDASGNGENDIMMLRPASVSENSSRGNKAYGEGSNFYHPNSESDGKYDLRGDVARIMLYVYVRWGNTGSMWGSAGVMQSLDVLLAWMEADPVDTWELGRNDSVQSITGTRNVFVDYPEFAFLLFGAEIPADMTTPSGEGSNKCDHNNFDAGVVTAPTCTTQGFTLYTCQTAGCGYSYKANIVAAKGHNYVDGTCTSCGEAEPAAPVAPEYATELEIGKPYKLGLYSTNKNATYYFTGVMSNFYGATVTHYEQGVDMYVEETNGGYHLYFIDSSNTKQFINLVKSETHYNFTFGTTASSVFTWDADKDALHTMVGTEDCYIGTYGTYVTMGVLQTSKMSSSDYIARLYTTENDCEHVFESVVTAPTCVATGYTTYTCTLCGYSYRDGFLEATGEHNYVDGACIDCGKTEPSGDSISAVIDFKDKANRTEYSTSKQVWSQNGITVTNNKGASTSNVGDYCNPARFYKSSTVIIAYPGMTSIEINCTGLESKYVDGWLNVTGATATNNGGIITIVFNAPVDSFTYSSLSAQSRAYSITVYAEESGSGETPVCKHENTKVEGAVAATCTTAGHTGKTVCSDCGKVISEGEEIPATGHNYVDGKCENCGSEQSTAPMVPSTATITFDNVSKRTELTTSKQVWQENGIVVTNEKGASTSNVADYSKPARFYKSSTLIIAYPGLNKIEVACNTSAYATALKDSVTGATVSVSGKVVTIELAEAADSFTIQLTGGQVRVDSITVHGMAAAETPEPECKHENTKVEGAVAATCTTDGHTGKTVCTDCGATISEGKTIPALGHTKETIPGKAATCTETGLTDGVKCSVCGEILTAQDEIPATGHNYENGSCTNCGEAEPTEPEQPVAPAAPTGDTIREDSIAFGMWCFVCQTDPCRYSSFGMNFVPEYITLGEVEQNAEGQWICEMTFRFAAFIEEVATVQLFPNHRIIFEGELPETTNYTLAWDDEHQCWYYMGELVYYNFEPICQHPNTTVEGNIPATCTTDGHTGKTVCTNCGATISEGKTIPALGHTKETIPGKAATCTETGLTDGVKCSVCGEILTAQEEIPALGHNYVDGSCTRCDEPDPNAPEQPGETTTSTVTYIMSNYKVDGELGGGMFVRELDDVLTFTISTGWFSTEARIYKNANGVLASTKPISTLVINAGYKTSTFDVYTSEDGETWTLYQEDVAYVSAYSDVTITFDAPVKYIKLDSPNAQIRIKTLTVTYVEEGTTPEPECKHENTKVEGAVAATCTTDGHTGKTVCTDCGATISEGETIPALGHTKETIPGKAATCTETGLTDGVKCSVCGEILTAQEEIPALGHNYVDGSCTRCDEPDPNAPGETTEATAVLDFSTTDQRVSQDENAQVWASGPVTLTNVKHNSTQPIKDYSNPARFYASTKTTIACVGMTKIVFVCPTSAYANDLMASIGSAYGTFTTETEGNNTVVTLELTESVDSIEFVHTKQTRFRSMTVTYVAPSESPECKHENTKVEGAVAANCTTDGYTGNTVCADCGVTISEGETIPATGHTMAYAVAQAPKENAAGSLSGTCSVCGEQDEVNLPALNNLDYACQILTTPAGATGGTARYTWKNTTYGEFSFETAYVYGDSNGDGKVNLQDLLLLRQYIVNSDPISNVSTLAACAGIDADCDGKVTLLDVLMLRQYIAYSDPTTGESLVVLGPQ